MSYTEGGQATLGQIQFLEKLMTTCIDTLRAYSQTELRGSDLAGFAAHDAERVLLDNWNRAIADGTKDPLLEDIGQVITRLVKFREEARKHIPVANGGLASIPLDAWKVRLANMDVEIYPCPQHRISRFGFTGCDDADFTSENDAIMAAVARHFG
jgi:hypothetical protein